MRQITKYIHLEKFHPYAFRCQPKSVFLISCLCITRVCLLTCDSMIDRVSLADYTNGYPGFWHTFKNAGKVFFCYKSLLTATRRGRNELRPSSDPSPTSHLLCPPFYTPILYSPPYCSLQLLQSIAVLHKGAKQKDIRLQGGFILTPEGPRKMSTRTAVLLFRVKTTFGQWLTYSMPS